MPKRTRPVSPCTMSTFSIGMPSRSATTCANVVSCPWPWLCEPVNTVTAAGRMHAHLAGLEQPGARAERARDVGRRDAARLDVRRVAEPAQLAAPARRPCGALRSRRRPRSSSPRRASPRSRRCRRAARPASGTGNSVMKLRRRISAGSMLHLARGGLDEALDDVGGFGPARAAIGVDRRGVGEHRGRLRSRSPASCTGPRAASRRGWSGCRTRTSTGRRPCSRSVVHAHREELAVLVERQLGVRHVVAAVRVGEERLASAPPST